jgi:hypothetical protein
VQDDGGSANGGVDLALAANTMTIDVSAVDDAPVIAQNTLTLAQGASVQLSAAQLSATDVDDPAAGLLFTVSAVTHGQFELSSAPALAIVSFTQAQIAAGQVLFVHDATTSAPTYDVSVSDGTLTAGPAPASISFSAGAPAIAPTSAPMPPPSIPSPAPVPAAPAQDPAEPAPLPLQPIAALRTTRRGGSDSASGGAALGAKAAKVAVAAEAGLWVQVWRARRASGVIAAADIVKPLRADVRELSPQKSSSWFYEAPSIIAVDLNLAGAIGSEPLMRFQGNAQADWSIASAYTDNSASEHKEQLSVLLDSAQFAALRCRWVWCGGRAD